jgi:protein MpaA
VTLNTLFLGAFHGDEGISTQLLETFQRYLQEECPTINHSEPFVIVPAVNPDGLALQQRMNAAGVDLNRNFPTTDWCEENLNSPYYSGPQAGSEPETQVMLRLLAAHRPAKIISVHAPYKVINFDGPARPLADRMAEFCGYPVVESIGYPTPGSFGTYVGKEREIATITLELPEAEPLETVWQDNREALLAALNF